jgi:hypothetical protein
MLADEPDGSHDIASSNTISPPTLGAAVWLTSCRPMAPSPADAPWRRSCATQLTFDGNAFMLFVLAFDPIFELATIVRQPFGDFVWSACCAALVFSIRVCIWITAFPAGKGLPGISLVFSTFIVTRLSTSALSWSGLPRGK